MRDPEFMMRDQLLHLRDIVAEALAAYHVGDPTSLGVKLEYVGHSLQGLKLTFLSYESQVNAERYGTGIARV